MHRRELLVAALLSPLVAGAASLREPLEVTAFPSVDAILKAARPDWQARHAGPGIEVVSREYFDHHNAMVTAIATGSHLPDVMAVELSFLGRFVGSGALEDLSALPYEAGRARDEFVPFAIRQATDRHGAIVALPTDVAPGALFYREDLYRRAGVAEEAFIASWESYVDTGARLKAATGGFLLGHARELKEVMIRSALKSGEGVYLDGEGRVLVESERFRRAFELARRVRLEKLDAKITTWSTEWSEALRTGVIATQMMGSWFAGHLANWLAPKTRGLWRSAPLPDGAHSAWGGTFYAIPKGARNKELAYELIRLMTLDPARQIAAFRSQDAFPALLAAQRDPFFDEPLPFLGGQRARLQWRDAASQIPASSVHKLDAIAAEIVDSALDEVLAGERSIPAALADAAALLRRRVERG